MFVKYQGLFYISKINSENSQKICIGNFQKKDYFGFQTHENIFIILVIKEGNVEGTVGRGVFRNYCKGHMDKIKGEEGGGFGWGLVEGWGENADN